MQSYYLKQAGSGLPIATFSGMRYQRGHGFFGSLFSRVLPILKYLGSHALETGKDILGDLKSSAKSRVASTAANIASDIASGSLKQRQAGEGVKVIKRKRAKKKSITSSYDFLK